MAKVKVTLKKGIFGRKQNHIGTVKALGLKKVNSEAEHELTPQIEGMINQVSYLIDVKKV